MKITGWILVAVGALLLFGAMYGYFTEEGPVGKVGPRLVSGVGLGGVPLVIGLLLLSKAEKKNASKPDAKSGA